MTPGRAQHLAVWEREPDGMHRYPRFGGVCGLDWGYARDASAAVVLSRFADSGANGEAVYFLPWLESHHRLAYHEMVGKCVEIARGWQIRVFASELNGPGPMPTQELRRSLLQERDLGRSVCGVWTDQRAKQAGMGAIKGALQRGTLVLPRHSGLLSELCGLVYEQTESSGLKIGPAAGSGSPDIAMALMQAIRCMSPGPNPDRHAFGVADLHKRVRLPSGAWFSEEPIAAEDTSCYRWPQGAERWNAGW